MQGTTTDNPPWKGAPNDTPLSDTQQHRTPRPPTTEPTHSSQPGAPAGPPTLQHLDKGHSHPRKDAATSPSIAMYVVLTYCTTKASQTNEAQIAHNACIY